MTPKARLLRCLPLTLLLLLPPRPTRAQTASPTVTTPTYDVVSIVPNKAGDTAGTGIEVHDATFTATNADLINLLINAFNIKPDLIFGLPPWAASTRWNLQAKIIDPDLPALKKLTDDQHRAMLQQVLADRFRFKAHTETKELPVYNLVVTAHGPRFKPSAKQGEADMGGMSSSDGEVTLDAYPVSAMAYTLSSILHRTVIDKTNLTAHYDLHLTWAPDNPAAAAGQNDGHPAADTGPSLFSALQDQLGLKLVPSKGPVPTLVIDHIEPPTAN